MVFSRSLAAGTGDALVALGYGPCSDVVATAGATATLDAAARGHTYLGAVGHLASATPVAVVECFNASPGHCFMTADADEIALLDGGGFGGTLVRTGQTFLARDAPAPGADDDCRFFTVAFAPLGPHFDTSDDFGCGIAEKNPDRQYEKPGLFAGLPVAGACIGSLPSYRACNDGRSGAPNHRYPTSLAIDHDFAHDRGWAGEGVVFCAPFQGQAGRVSGVLSQKLRRSRSGCNRGSGEARGRHRPPWYGGVAQRRMAFDFAANCQAIF